MSEVGAIRTELGASLVDLINKWKGFENAANEDEKLCVVESEYVIPACKRCRDLVKALDELDKAINGLAELGIEV